MKKRRRALLLAVGVALAASSAVASFLAWRARQPFVLEDPGSRVRLTGLAFSPLDDRLAARRLDGSVVIWSLRDRTVAGRVGRARDDLELSPTGVGFAPDDRLILESGFDAVTLLTPPSWSAGGPAADWPSRGDIRVQGRLVARTCSLAGMGSLAVWDVSLAPPACLRRIVSGFERPLLALSGAGDRLVVAAPLSRTVVVHELLAGGKLTTETSVAIASLAASPVSDVIAIGAVGGTVELLSFDGAIRSRIDLRPPPDPETATTVARMRPQSVPSVAFSPDGRTLAAVCVWHAENPLDDHVRSWVALWDLAHARALGWFDAKALGLPGGLETEGSEATAVAFSPSGELVGVAFGKNVCVFRAP